MMKRAGSVAACALALFVADLGGQTPDTTSVEPMGNCVLEWGAPPGEGAPALRHTQDDSGEVADFFSGRTLFTCGTATMLADSAVSYETRGEVYLVGNVAYQDSLRTLESTYLTYFERADLVVADENVRLVRVNDRSTLVGPHVEFLRAVSGVDELTTATGRPHMTFYPDGEDPGPPFEVDADWAVFAGEDEARAYGNVIIDREDMKGEADSIRLRREAETGEMWGDPWIEAEDVRLEGEMIHFRSVDDVLEDIHAVGDGRAVGESFEVIASIIDIRLADEQPERVWAHGAGLSRALSGEHNVYGDSLEFAMFEGAIDTLYALGTGIAVQGEESLPDDGSSGDESAQPDSATVAAVADSSLMQPSDSTLLQPADSALVAAADSTLVQPTDSALLQPADSTLVQPVDSTLVQQADSALALPVDSLAAPSDSSVVADSATVSSVAIGTDSLTVQDSSAVSVVAAPVVTDTLDAVTTDSTGAVTADSTVVVDDESQEAPADPAAGGPVALPTLRVTGASTWVRGDTLIAVFVRAGSSGGETEADVASVPVVPPDTTAAAEATISERALVPVDSLVVIDPAPMPADSAPDPVMERLIAIGDARSLFSQVRDSTQSDRESKNYMMGKRIELLFEDGEPSIVTGEEAIGVFLDPEASGGAGQGPAGAFQPDSSGVAADSLTAAADSSQSPIGAQLPDSTSTLPDSLLAPPDTAAVPPDTTAAPPDTSSVASLERPGDETGVTGYPGGDDLGIRERAVAITRRRGVWWVG